MAKHYNHKQEKEIWEDLLWGKEDALIHIYDTYVDYLYNYGKRITGDNDLIKDSIQDLFINIWDRREHLGKVNSISNYLLMSLRRKILKKVDAGKNLSTIESDDDPNFQLKGQSHEFNIILDELNVAKQEKLRSGIQNLPSRQKEALFLKFYDNKTNNEIAKVMDLNVQSVYNLVHQAIENLKESLINQAKLT